MGVKRLVRVNELLRQEVAAALYRVMDGAGFDFSAVTVTGVITSSDLHTARVRVSIRDHLQDRAKILGQLRRHRGPIQEILSRNVVLKYTPKLTFELDESIEEGDHVLEIIRQMEQAGPPADPGDAPPSAPDKQP
jgi:ribosome-binding factor A